MSDPHPTHHAVRKAYARVAASGSGCCGGGSCCGSSAETTATGVGYSPEELAFLPAGANLGLSCGNPMALADLGPGEFVLDLGCGAGMDAFLAAERVGPEGLVVGVDMTPEMLARAGRNAERFRQRTGLANVEFHLGQIEAIPLPAASVDVVISNCVLNLSPEQPRVWREIVRVLKPGGRVAISDMVLLKPLPAALAARIEALVGCIAGAPQRSDLERMIADAGLVEVRLQPKEGAVEAMFSDDDPLAALLPPGEPLSAFVASFNIAARKPT